MIVKQTMEKLFNFFNKIQFLCENIVNNVAYRFTLFYMKDLLDKNMPNEIKKVFIEYLLNYKKYELKTIKDLLKEKNIKFEKKDIKKIKNKLQRLYSEVYILFSIFFILFFVVIIGIPLQIKLDEIKLEILQIVGLGIIIAPIGTILLLLAIIAKDLLDNIEILENSLR